jgi:phosphoribosylformylglycinamidine synthase
MPGYIYIFTGPQNGHMLVQWELADSSESECLDNARIMLTCALSNVFGLSEPSQCVIPSFQHKFIAPYTNFMTTDSTTLIEIINKCGLLLMEPSSQASTDRVPTIKLIRIEQITILSRDDCEVPHYDKLTHRIYNSLDEYINIVGEYRSSESNMTATKFEIEDWKQCNSEHSRHWFFRTPIPALANRSLFDLVKSTLTDNPRAQANSLVAFSDNSSAIKSCVEMPRYLARDNNRMWQSTERPGMNPCLTAETHNFPTYYHPFEGANTGIGGRIRDNLAVGTGSLSSASWAGYSMSNLEMAKVASDGASNYANKVGEPLLGGYLRWNPNFAKPILYTAGVGWIADNRLITADTMVQPGDLVIKVGPQAFKIGMGGSLMSSVDNKAAGTQDALTAVQRGDPYEGNKVVRFCEYLATQPDGRGLIHKIHDQGAGGLGNVVKELVEPHSAEIDLSSLPHAPGMTTLECWLSEYQEQMVFTAPESSLPELERLARREGCGLVVLGRILPEKANEPCIHLTGVSGEKFDFYYKRLAELPELANRFNPILSEYKEHMTNNKLLLLTADEPVAITGTSELSRTQSDLKLWLTTKIDRSVGGCVIQQSHVGPYGLPMADYGILAANPDGSGGLQVSALAENIWVGQSPREFAVKCIAELVGNLAGSGIRDLSLVKLSANWMWYIKNLEYCDLMVQCAESLVAGLRTLDLAIDGGKDSLSMSIDMPDGSRVISPPTLVLAGYASLPSGCQRVTPVLVAMPPTDTDDEATYLWAMDLMELLMNSDRVNSTAIDALNIIFRGVREGWVLAMHDGDTIQETIEEMCLVSLHGFELLTGFPIDKLTNPPHMRHWLVWQATEHAMTTHFPVDYLVLKVGRVNPFSRELSLSNDRKCSDLFTERMRTTLELMPQICNSAYLAYQPWEYTWLPDTMAGLPTAEQASELGVGRRVAIIRDMGSNSHREMAAVFTALGCSAVLDITVNDLLDETREACTEMANCDGIVFVGGFAYGDVLGSGKATAMVIMSNHRVHSTILTMARNPSKFILGVCNGAQIILALDLLPVKVKLVTNDSGRFESWFLPVQTPDRQQLGIWCAHGEGKFVFPSQDNPLGNQLELVGQYTSSEYPASPNGSQLQAVGVRTKPNPTQTIANADIVAIMPHPERSVFKSQCEYIPPELLIQSAHTPFTPWINFFIELLNQNQNHKTQKNETSTVGCRFIVHPTSIAKV